MIASMQEPGLIKALSAELRGRGFGASPDAEALADLPTERLGSSLLGPLALRHLATQAPMAG